MNDPMPARCRPAAHNDYIIADDCYRETSVALAEAQAIAVRTPPAVALIEQAEQLMAAARQHRAVAAAALRQSAPPGPQVSRTADHGA